MGNLTINNGGIIINSDTLPNVDLRYGPYNSIEDANTALNGHKIPGLTVGIKQGGGGIKEYWYQLDPQTGTLELTQKQEDVEIDYNSLDNKPKINNIELDGNISLSELGAATKSEVNELAGKVDKLPTGRYYGQYDSVENLPDYSQLSEKGYAYVSSIEPNVYYIYLYNGDGESWQDSGNKFVTTNLETNLETKSQTNAPTTKAVAEGIEAIDITIQQSYTNNQQETARTNIGAQEDIPEMQDKFPVVAALNDRVAVSDEVDGATKLRSMGYKVLKAPVEGDSTTEIQEQLSPTTEGTSVPIPNTIFEVRDCFDLNNTTLTVPDDCILLFNGGKIINGTIKGSRTIIQAPDYQIFENITFSGTFIGSLNVCWLGAKSGNSNFDNSPIVQKWFGSTNSNGYCKVWKTLEFPTNTYYFLSPITSNSDNSSTNRHLAMECNNSLFKTKIPTNESGNGQSFLTIQLEEFNLKNVRIYNQDYDKTIAIRFYEAQRFSVENIEVWYFDIAYYFVRVWYGSFSGKQTIRGNRVGIYTFRGSSGSGEINTVDFHNLSIGDPPSRSSVNSVFRKINEPFLLNLSEQLILDNTTYNISDTTLTISSGNQIQIPSGYCLINNSKSSLVTEITATQTTYSTSGSYYVASIENSGEVTVDYEESNASLETRVPICGFDIHTPINTCKIYGCTIEGMEYGIKENRGSYTGSSVYRTTDDIEVIDSCYFEANKKYNIYVGSGYYSKDYNGSVSYPNPVIITRNINITNCRFFEGSGGTLASSFSLVTINWRSNQPALLYFENTENEGHNELIDDGLGVTLMKTSNLFRTKQGMSSRSILNTSNNTRTSVFSLNRHSLKFLGDSSTAGIPINSLSPGDSNEGSYKEVPSIRTISTFPRLSNQETVRAGEIQSTLYGTQGDTTLYRRAFTYLDTSSGVQKKSVHADNRLFNQVTIGRSTGYTSSQEKSASITEFFSLWDAGTSFVGYVEKLWAYKIYADPSVGFVYIYDSSKHSSGYTQSDVVGFGNTALANSENYTNDNLFDGNKTNNTIAGLYAVYLDGMVLFHKGKKNIGGWKVAMINECDFVLNYINNNELAYSYADNNADSGGYWIAAYGRRLSTNSELQESYNYKYLNNIMYSRRLGKTLIYDGYNWVPLSNRFMRYTYVESGSSISKRMTAGLSSNSTYYNYATGILYRFKVNKTSANCGTWISSIGNVNSLEHPNDYNETTNPITYATELVENESVMCNGKLYVWGGEAWKDIEGNYLPNIQVTSKNVLLESAANSSNTVGIYTSDTPNTPVVLNSDDSDASSWLSASLSGTVLTITALSANSDNPKGGKVVLTNTTDEVVINVVQNYL